MQTAGQQLREIITNFLVEQFQEVQECFKDLKPKEKIKAFFSMLPFAVPKLKAAHSDEFDMLSGDQVDDLFERLKATQTHTQGSA
jgi:hypothetical protein